MAVEHQPADLFRHTTIEQAYTGAVQFMGFPVCVPGNDGLDILGAELVAAREEYEQLGLLPGTFVSVAYGDLWPPAQPQAMRVVRAKTRLMERQLEVSFDGAMRNVLNDVFNGMTMINGALRYQYGLSSASDDDATRPWISYDQAPVPEAIEKHPTSQGEGALFTVSTKMVMGRMLTSQIVEAILADDTRRVYIAPAEDIARSNNANEDPATVNLMFPAPSPREVVYG